MARRILSGLLSLALVGCAAAPPRLEVADNILAEEAASARVTTVAFAPQSVPSGSTTVVAFAGDVFTLAAYSEKSAKEKSFCLRVHRNGFPWSPPLCPNVALGNDTPMLFRHDNELLVLIPKWDGSGATKRSALLLRGIALEEGSWKEYGTFFANGGRLWTSLGATIATDGTLIVAGRESGNGAEDSLSVTSTVPPYDAWQPHPEPIKVPRAGNIPVAPQVLVEANGAVRLLATFTPRKACPSTEISGPPATAIASFLGGTTEAFRLMWSESAEGGTDPFRTGAGCHSIGRRAAFDVLADKEIEEPLALVFRTTPRRWALVRAGATVHGDLTPLFSPAIVEGAEIDSMAMTQLFDGTYIFTATGDKLGVVAAIATKTFEEFSEPIRLDAPEGVGGGLGLSQPKKNGSEVTQETFLWFRDANTREPAGENAAPRYRLVRVNTR